MMKLLLTNACFISFQFCFTQTKFPTAQEVNDVINLTINQKVSKKNSVAANGLEGDWWIANKDSIYFTSDTIILYNSSNIVYGHNEFCPSFIWDFNKKKEYTQRTAQLCVEPPLFSSNVGFTVDENGKFIKSNVPNKYQIISKDSFCFINILIDKKVYESYKVISLKKTVAKELGENSYSLILVKQKKT